MTLIILFLLISTVYSSAGFGGGSSYLAIMALFQFDYVSIRMLALLCNLTVVSTSVFLFYKSGYLNIKRVVPLVLLSIPMAFLGGLINISEDQFFFGLGLTLLIAAILMLINNKKATTLTLPKYSSSIIGGSIGFLSGIVGIGGGIFLSPVLYHTKWAGAKAIAATTAVFILANSTSGLIGQVITHGISLDMSLTFTLMGTVFVGGQIGSRLTTSKLDPIWVKRITGVLILIVGCRLLYRSLVL